MGQEQSAGTSELLLLLETLPSVTRAFCVDSDSRAKCGCRNYGCGLTREELNKLPPDKQNICSYHRQPGCQSFFCSTGYGYYACCPSIQDRLVNCEYGCVTGEHVIPGEALRPAVASPPADSVRRPDKHLLILSHVLEVHAHFCFGIWLEQKQTGGEGGRSLGGDEAVGDESG